MAIKAYGTILKFNDAGSGSYTNVLNVKSIKPFKVQAKDIDITTLTSPDEFEEVIAGLGSGGELECNVQYDSTQTHALYAIFRTVKGFQLVYPNGTGWHFIGYLSEIGDEEVQNGEIVMTTIKIKVTGKPTHETSL